MTSNSIFFFVCLLIIQMSVSCRLPVNTISYNFKRALKLNFVVYIQIVTFDNLNNFTCMNKIFFDTHSSLTFLASAKINHYESVGITTDSFNGNVTTNDYYSSFKAFSAWFVNNSKLLGLFYCRQNSHLKLKRFHFQNVCS